MLKWRKLVPSSRNCRLAWFRRRKPSGGLCRANCMMKWARRYRPFSLNCAIFRLGLAVRSEEQSRRHVETIKGLVESTVRVVRNMALLLRPSMLDDLGLVPALKWQARESSKSTSMDVTDRGGTRFRRIARRVQDLHLSRGPGSAPQLRTAFACDHRPYPRATGARSPAADHPG